MKLQDLDDPQFLLDGIFFFTKTHPNVVCHVMYVKCPGKKNSGFDVRYALHCGGRPLAVLGEDWLRRRLGRSHRGW